MNWQGSGFCVCELTVHVWWPTGRQEISKQKKEGKKLRNNVQLVYDVKVTYNMKFKNYLQLINWQKATTTAKYLPQIWWTDCFSWDKRQMHIYIYIRVCLHKQRTSTAFLRNWTSIQDILCCCISSIFTLMLSYSWWR